MPQGGDTERLVRGKKERTSKGYRKRYLVYYLVDTFYVARFPAQGFTTATELHELEYGDTQ
jgi:hypothetical protein